MIPAHQTAHYSESVKGPSALPDHQQQRLAFLFVDASECADQRFLWAQPRQHAEQGPRGPAYVTTIIRSGHVIPEETDY
jgi:hypothetical protein